MSADDQLPTLREQQSQACWYWFKKRDIELPEVDKLRCRVCHREVDELIYDPITSKPAGKQCLSPEARQHHSLEHRKYK